MVSAFSAAIRPPIDVVGKGSTVYLDGRPTTASGSYNWYADAQQPRRASR